MAERGLAVDHSTVWRWVQHYAPMPNQRLRRELRQTNRSWRVDETYIRVASRWTYLYHAVDSKGNTIDFMLSPYRDLIAAKHFLQLALSRSKQIRPRVYQCGWPLGIRPRHQRTESKWRTRASMPV